MRVVSLFKSRLPSLSRFLYGSGRSFICTHFFCTIRIRYCFGCLNVGGVDLKIVIVYLLILISDPSY